MRGQLATQLCVRQMLESLTPHEREVLDLAVTGLHSSQPVASSPLSLSCLKTRLGNLIGLR